jgi:thioredoxin 1
MISSVNDFNQIISSGGWNVIKCSADWCGPCKKIAPKYYELSKKYTNVRFYTLDVDKVEINIKSVPTFLVFYNGNHMGTVSGTNLQQVEALLRT